MSHWPKTGLMYVVMFYYFYKNIICKHLLRMKTITTVDIRHKGKDITNINNLTIKEVRN